VAKRHQDFGHSGEGLFEPDDLLKTPFSLSVSKRTEVWIVIIHSVNAGLDSALDSSLPSKCKSTAKPRQAQSVLRRNLAAVDALVLAEMESCCGPIV